MCSSFSLLLLASITIAAPTTTMSVFNARFDSIRCNPTVEKYIYVYTNYCVRVVFFLLPVNSLSSLVLRHDYRCFYNYLSVKFKCDWKRGGREKKIMEISMRYRHKVSNMKN